MRDSDWEILASLYETKNITKTARRLYMSQPSLTKRLKGIEEEYAVSIADRTPGGLVFTPAGEILAQRSQLYLAFLQETRELVDAARRQDGNELKIGAAYNYSKYTLSGILLLFSAQYPDISVTVVNESSNILFRKVLDRTLDAAFICGDYESDLRQILVGRSRACLMTDKKTTPDLENLSSMQWVGYKSNDKTREILGEWWMQTCRTPMPSGGSVGFLDFAWELVGKGFGYTVCFIPDGFRNEYGLTVTPLSWPDGTPVTRSTWFVYRDDGNISKSLENFADYIRETEEIEGTSKTVSR